MEEVIIDGSRGEGGGQILRTSLALSVITRRPVQFHKIRAGRKKPGLMRQHLTAAKAAAAICGAELRDAGLGSSRLGFTPGPLEPGEYTFSVGTAGSACLVLQTVLPALLTASAPSRLVLEGGTHNPMAPPFDFLQRCFTPLLARMGARVDLSLERAGFYPAGGGRFIATITPAARLEPIEVIDRGKLQQRRARALIANLPEHIARRELATVRDELGWAQSETAIETLTAKGPCNALLLDLCYEHASEIVTAFGERGVRAEAVAATAAAELREYERSGAPIGVHLADQLMLPLALAGGGRYRTMPLSLHSRTNLETIGRFLDVAFHLEEQGDGTTVVEVHRR